MKINAWMAQGPKQELVPQTYEKDGGENDVIIKIKYRTLTKGDQFFIDNFWNDTRYPLVPSSEMFGIVTQVGNKVKDIKIGDYVGVGYQVYSCLECAYCKQGREQFCKQQRLICIHEYGGLAEYIIANSNFVFRIPAQLQKPEYTPLLGYGLTAFSAVRNARLEKDMSVAVMGLGNLGHLAAQLLVKMGYNTTAFTHSKDKILTLKKFGIQHFFDPMSEKQMNENKGKYDVIFITTYHSYNWTQCIELLKPEGNLCFIGLPAENISFPAVLLADYARRTISGSYIGSREDMQELLLFAQKNDLRASIELFPMSHVNAVLKKIRSNEVQFSVVLESEQN